MIVEAMSPSTERRACPTCKRMGLVEPIEMVPGSGVLYRCTHDDGTPQCQWSKFDDLDAVRSAKTDHPRRELKCPECKEWGVIVAEQDESDRMKPDNWNYYLSHPTGKRRCLVRPEHRELVLKALGRYIQKLEVSGRSRKRQKYPQIVCPRCNLIGSTRIRGNNLVVIHRNLGGSGKEKWHSMQTHEQKEKFLSVVHVSATAVAASPADAMIASMPKRKKRGRGKVTSYNRIKAENKKLRIDNHRLEKSNTEKMEYIQSLEENMSTFLRKNREIGYTLR